MQLLFSLITIASIVSVGYANFLEFHSFEPPYSEVDVSGVRLASPNWRASGTTIVNNNFIRLTPDRQSKKGALWSRKSIGVPNLSSVLKFRISGQGKNFFGDGLALWIVQDGYYVEGEVHGFKEKFVGIGIIFDTFRNTERLSAHRDVTVLINDGTKTYEMMTENVIGCDTNVRYHADRADFSVTDASRAKVVLNDTSLDIFIDPRNVNEWTFCASIPALGLPPQWLQRAHIGMTATTGQLADNHDVLYLKTFSTATALDEEEEAEFSETHFELPDDLHPEEKTKALEEVLNKLITRHETLDHVVEHQVAAITDHIKNLIGKLEKREDKSEARLENLEALIKQEVEGSLERRLSALEMQMKGSVERKMSNIESALDRKMTRMESQASEMANTSSESWKLPFFLLLIVIVAAAVGLYLFYLKMKKMHIL
jgi:mannose-binding lectin 2